MMESKIRLTVGILLLTLASSMTVGLFSAFGEGRWHSLLVAVLWAGGLEAGKILSWRRAGWYRLLAVSLSLVTLLGVLGTALAQVEARSESSSKGRLEALIETREYEALKDQTQSLRAQKAVLVKRLSGLPADFVTASKNLSRELEGLRNEEKELQTAMGKLETSATYGAVGVQSTVFAKLGKAVGLPEARTELFLLLFLGLLTEVTAFSLLGHVSKKPPVNPHQDIGTNRVSNLAQSVPAIREVSPEAYLAKALDHPRQPYLLGRRIVAERLGIQDREARELLETLHRAGRIRRHSKYFEAVE